MNNVHFSSGKDDWQTPRELFRQYDDVWHFAIDAAADQHNHQCDWWWGPGGECENALDVDWALHLKNGLSIWLNPPYSRGLQSKFVEKAFWAANVAGSIAAQPGHVVCLLPSRTDTKLFHDFVMYGEVTFLRGRVKFVGAAHGAPFPSLVVVF